MSTHLKLNFLVQCFNGSNNSETQSHDDSKEGVLSAGSKCLLLPLVYVREKRRILLQKLMKEET